MIVYFCYNCGEIFEGFKFSDNVICFCGMVMQCKEVKKKEKIEKIKEILKK